MSRISYWAACHMPRVSVRGNRQVISRESVPWCNRRFDTVDRFLHGTWSFTVLSTFSWFETAATYSWACVKFFTLKIEHNIVKYWYLYFAWPEASATRQHSYDFFFFFFVLANDADRLSWWDLMFTPRPMWRNKVFIVVLSSLLHASPRISFFILSFREKI